MMTKEKTAKRKLFRMIWGIPVLAILLMAFAKPEYQMQSQKDSFKAKNLNVPKADYLKSEGEEPIHLNLKKDTPVKVKGTVIDDKGNPMHGASVILRGTTTGTVADKDGTFKLEIPEGKDWAIVVSYVGYKTILNGVEILKDETNLKFKFVLQREVISIDSKDLMNAGDVPPPPPPPAPEFDKKSDKPVFFIVEEMPEYKQGFYGLSQYVKKQKSKLKNKFGKKLKGKATVGFTVDANGKVSNIQILDKSNDIAAKAATKIASGMENWKPGSQRGKKVSVDFAVEVEF